LAICGIEGDLVGGPSPPVNEPDFEVGVDPQHGA
jgi:hypothetical protein